MLDLQSFKGFTPGPWSRQSEWEVWCDWNDRPNAPLFRANMDYRRWGRDISLDERVANAALAAAAPDLLALAIKQEAEIKGLKEIVGNLVSLVRAHTGPDDVIGNTAIAEAYEAIHA